MGLLIVAAAITMSYFAFKSEDRPEPTYQVISIDSSFMRKQYRIIVDDKIDSNDIIFIAQKIKQETGPDVATAIFYFSELDTLSTSTLATCFYPNKEHAKDGLPVDANGQAYKLYIQNK